MPPIDSHDILLYKTFRTMFRNIVQHGRSFSLPDELDQRLREYADKEYSGTNGSLSIIAARALEEYLNKVAKKRD